MAKRAILGHVDETIRAERILSVVEALCAVASRPE
jgi:hypothetical protein